MLTLSPQKVHEKLNEAVGAMHSGNIPRALAILELIQAICCDEMRELDRMTEELNTRLQAEGLLPEQTCKARVWDNGDMTSCDGTLPCSSHVKKEE